jgi:fatty-acyl-CoA synthase
VLIGHDAVIAQLGMLYRHYYYDGVRRSTVSWAPFFHDLGLIASVILPPYTRSTVELLPTEIFARDPTRWLRLIEATRAVGTLGPSSAFGSALRAARRRGERIDLSSLEVAHFAAEGVDPEVARRMGEEGREFGLHPEALGSTYGLAEAVLGVAYTTMGAGLRTDWISLDGLARDGVATPATSGPARLMVSCGRPVMGLRIVGGEGRPVPEREVGEIQLRGRSLTSGYVGAGATAPFTADGWLRTGDLGYLASGELYVTGRAKDMVIAVGQNYYPEDFEWAAGRVEGVRRGRCVAFTLPGTEKVALLVEPADPGADPVALRHAVSLSVAKAVGVRAAEVKVVPRGTIEKTTSGKLRRAAMRKAHAAGELPTAVAGAA